MSLIIDQKNEKAKYDQDEGIALAYMTAMWAAQWFSKKKPEPLEKLLSHKPESKTMSDEEMFQKVKLLHKLFGGE